MNKKYLIYLAEYYDGDHAYFVVGPATYEWIRSERPKAFDKGKTLVYETVPKEVIAEATNLDEETPKRVGVTCGSCENDRAIHAMSMFKVRKTPPKGEFDGYYEGVIY